MSASRPYRQQFEPVPADTTRPFWSVMIPTYNRASLLRAALASVLGQDPGPDQMQIEVVDDCSNEDDPKAVVDELARDRVTFYRQTQNFGQIRNLNTCIERARGELVHILHSDDCVRPGFYRTMEDPFRQHPEIGAAFCRYISMDAAGNWETIAPLEPDGRGVLADWLERIAMGQRLQAPCMVVRRSVYERLGGFDARLDLCEDWEMWTRIAASFPVWYEPEPLGLYRVHAASTSGTARKTDAEVSAIRRVIEMNRELLPPGRADELTARAREIAAITAIRRAGRMAQAGNGTAAREQVREALKTRVTPAVLERLALFGLLWLRYRAKGLRRQARPRYRSGSGA